MRAPQRPLHDVSPPIAMATDRHHESRATAILARHAHPRVTIRDDRGSPGPRRACQFLDVAAWVTEARRKKGGQRWWGG